MRAAITTASTIQTYVQIVDAFRQTLKKDRHERSCELRMHGANGEWGIETQILNDGELLIGRRFDTGDVALQWAMVERYPRARPLDTNSGLVFERGRDRCAFSGPSVATSNARTS